VTIGSTIGVPVKDDNPRHHLRAHLRELVAELGVGARIPSERDLAAEWGVARMTIRRAVDSLISEGLLERRHGSGTYVTPQPCVRLLGLTSFTDDMRERGMVASSKLLAFGRGPANEKLATQLQVRADEEVVSFTRLRLADDTPMAVETVWITARLVPGLTGDHLAGSLYSLLAARYNIVPGAASVAIEPIVPTPRIREHLAIDDEQACLRLRMVDSDARGKVIMVANGVYRGDRYQLHAEIAGAAFAGRARRAG